MGCGPGYPIGDGSNAVTARTDDSAAGAGLILGVQLAHVSGFHPLVAATEVVLWSPNPTAAYSGFLVAADTIRVRAGGNAADTAAGAGARQVTIVGLGQTGSPLVESVATAGAGASASTVGRFSRVHQTYVSQSGTYSDGITGGNVGQVLIETTGGILVDAIGVQAGQSETAVYTVPLGFTAYLMSVHASVDGTTSQRMNVRVYQRPNYLTVAAPFGAKRIVELYAGVTSVYDDTYGGALSFPALTDLWLTAERAGGAGNIPVNGSMELELRAS